MPARTSHCVHGRNAVQARLTDFRLRLVRVPFPSRDCAPHTLLAAQVKSCLSRQSRFLGVDEELCRSDCGTSEHQGLSDALT